MKGISRFFVRALAVSTVMVTTTLGASQARADPPLFVALDGIALFATCATSIPCTLVATPLVGAVNFAEWSAVRTEPYLGPALAQKWNRNACEGAEYLDRARRGDGLECDIVTVPWNGELSNSARIRSYARLSRELLLNIIENTPSRPLVIVAHSWGSVVAIQALTELENLKKGSNRRVAPDSVATLVTIGSPLHASERAVAGRILKAILRALPSTIPGQSLVTGEVVRKPDVVSHWINYWIRADIISSSVPSADENGKLSSLEIANPHSLYYSEQNNAEEIYQQVNATYGYTCKNILTANDTVPNGFGAAFNVFSAARELVVHVDCAGSSGAKIEVGSGSKTQRIAETALLLEGGAWKRISLSPAGVGSESTEWPGWIERHAETTIPIVSGVDNFVAAFVCHLDSGEWKCGCQDTSCAEELWQMQAVRP